MPVQGLTYGPPNNYFLETVRGSTEVLTAILYIRRSSLRIPAVSFSFHCPGGGVEKGRRRPHESKGGRGPEAEVPIQGTTGILI